MFNRVQSDCSRLAENLRDLSAFLLLTTSIGKDDLIYQQDLCICPHNRKYHSVLDWPSNWFKLIPINYLYNIFRRRMRDKTPYNGDDLKAAV